MDATGTAQPCCTPIAAVAVDDAEAALLARRFAALGDPVRLRLVSLLLTAPGAEACVCDLTGPLRRSQPTVSHHVRALVDAGLVVSERRGRNTWYRVLPESIDGLRRALSLG